MARLELLAFLLALFVRLVVTLVALSDFGVVGVSPGAHPLGKTPEVRV